MIQLSYGNSKPIYEQVKDGLRQLMLSGVLTENAKLPSVRELAVKLTINPNTIQRAYRELESEGYIVSIPGKGSFVASGSSALSSRRAELKESFISAAKELRAIGVSEDELQSMLKEVQEQ